MKKYSIPGVTIAIMVLLMACQAKKKKENDLMSSVKEYAKDHPGINAGAGTYSITAPDNWIKKDTVMEGTKLTTITSPLEGPGDDFRENVNIITEAAKGYSYKEYAAVNLKTIKRQMPDVNIISEEELKIGDEPAKAIVYSFQYGRYDLKNTAYFVARNDIGYVITCTAVIKKFDKFQTDFLTCVNSFKIGN